MRAAAQLLEGLDDTRGEPFLGRVREQPALADALERRRFAADNRRGEEQPHGSPSLAGTVGYGAHRLDELVDEVVEELERRAARLRERGAVALRLGEALGDLSWG